MSDISLCYTMQGAGPPLLLLHGNGQDGSYFSHQSAYFARRYTVYAIDTRGHGKTLRGRAPFTIDQFAEDLLDFMDEHDMAQVRILGFKLASLFAGYDPKAKRNAERLGLMVNHPHIDPAALEDLYVPTLVIVGTKDMIKDSHTVLIANSLPNSKLEVIAGDHFIAAKNPEAFNKAVEKFLE